jgi:hypothetical protein
VAWTIGHAAVIGHAGAGCDVVRHCLLHALARVRHRKPGHRRERQGQDDEYGQQCTNSVHDYEFGCVGELVTVVGGEPSYFSMMTKEKQNC